MKRLVVWGGQNTMESHRHIHRGFYNAARKTGIHAVWAPDDPGFQLQAGDTVIAANIWSKHLRSVPGVDYVLHNFDGADQVVTDTDPEHILRLQVWTHDAFGEQWDTHRFYDRESRILFQPWGTDLLAEEFMEPVFNPMNRDVVFVGAVWSDTNTGVELGNTNAIEELKRACAQSGLTFTHLTQVSDQEMIRVTREARLAPTVVGNWQTEHGYLPCRAFKHASYGIPVFSNSPTVQDMFGWRSSDDTAEMLGYALSLKQPAYMNLVRAQQKVAARYTYRESLQAIERALTEGRAGPEGAPFLDWRTHTAVPSHMLAQRVEALRVLLIPVLETLQDATHYLGLIPDAVDVLQHTHVALSAALPYAENKVDLPLRDINARAEDWLRHDPTMSSARVLQRVSEQIARIEAAL